jgi:hypothetical protein
MFEKVGIDYCIFTGKSNTIFSTHSHCENLYPCFELADDNSKQKFCQHDDKERNSNIDRMQECSSKQQKVSGLCSTTAKTIWQAPFICSKNMLPQNIGFVVILLTRGWTMVV